MPYSDGEALYRAILDNPADDTVRLVYADWLDESGNDAARAEFIRVQVELARKRASEPPAPTKELAKFVRDLVQLENRERKLRAAHGRGWARVPWGQGGKGDAFDWQLTGPPTVAPPESGVWSASYPLACATPHWHRGFVGRVDVPALSWVCEFVPPKWDNPPEWRVTPWAIAIARTHPVTEFVIGDREPQPWNATEGPFTWERDTSPTFPHELLPVLWGELEGATLDNTFDGIKVYESRKNALLALAQAAGRFVRRAAGYAS